MAREVRKGGKAYYQCGNCKFVYNEKQFAEKCQKWCNAHGSCNFSIARHAVKI